MNTKSEEPEWLHRDGKPPISDEKFKFFRQIFELSNDLMMSVDKAGHILDMNANGAAILGRNRDDMIGRPFLDFIDVDDHDRVLRDYERHLAGDGKSDKPINWLCPDGSKRPTLLSVIWLEDAQVACWIGRDMSDRVHVEAQQQLVRRMEAMGVMARSVAHDFNNLLTVILCSADSLVAESASGRQRELAQLILEAARRGCELSARLQVFEPRHAPEPTAFAVNRILAGMELQLTRTYDKDLRIIVRTPADLKPVFADPVQAEAAILQVCHNACEAMAEGGLLSIEAVNTRIDASRGEVAPGDYVLITVADDCAGSASDFGSRIFEPCLVSRETLTGSGLGLNMACSFARQSGGHMEVQSKTYPGTLFRLYLPVASTGHATGSASNDDIRSPGVPRGQEKILVVEDNELVRRHVRSKLNNLGYQVVVAANGPEALRVLEDADDIDLVFTDVVMSGGMNGLELGEIAQSRWPGLNVLYTSGYAADILTRNGQLLPGVQLLSKPYSKSQLATKIRQALIQDR